MSGRSSKKEKTYPKPFTQMMSSAAGDTYVQLGAQVDVGGVLVEFAAARRRVRSGRRQRGGRTARRRPAGGGLRVAGR
jgi:hypothetical protein